MKTVLTTTKQSNPDVKWAIILFPRPEAIEKRPVPHLQATHHPADATSPIYKLSVPFFDKGTPE
eukprot:12833499-Ditylum_brightwellii.AAC.1